MKIVDEIKFALSCAIKEAGTQELLSKKCGIPRNYFSRYINGQTKAISDENWEKLEPYIRAFLPIKAVSESYTKYAEKPPSSPHRPDCEEICKELNNFELNLLRRYLKLHDEERETAYEEHKRLITELEKKYTEIPDLLGKSKTG
jgi:hypothetical protein